MFSLPAPALDPLAKRSPRILASTRTRKCAHIDLLFLDKLAVQHASLIANNDRYYKHTVCQHQWTGVPPGSNLNEDVARWPSVVEIVMPSKVAQNSSGRIRPVRLARRIGANGHQRSALTRVERGGLRVEQQQRRADNRTCWRPLAMHRWCGSEMRPGYRGSEGTEGLTVLGS